MIRREHGDFVMTKRLLGALFILAGVGGAAGLLLLDVVRGGLSDFGPTQAFALVACGGLVALGLTLLPLGDKPA
jgi:hypothetical protein